MDERFGESEMKILIKINLPCLLLSPSLISTNVFRFIVLNFDRALDDAKIKPQDIDCVCFTKGLLSYYTS